MRILVLGSEGQLGSELCKALEEHDLIPVKHSLALPLLVTMNPLFN